MSRGLCNFEAYSERDIKLIGDIFEKDIEVYGTIEISKKNVCWRDGAPGLKPSLFQIRYGDISLRYYDNPERSCAGVYKIETHA